jgi:thiosulfate reductase cytochrome b subunit
MVLALGTEARAQQPVNPIHPTFAPLDEAGRKVQSGGEVSAEKTCGQCHDVSFIGTHDLHASKGAKANCIQCHLAGGRLEPNGPAEGRSSSGPLVRGLEVRPESLDAEGFLRRDALRIGAPRAENCGSCHGLITGAGAQVLIPPDFEAPRDEPRSSLTLGEGAIVSPERMSDSFLNLEGKSALSSPWDVHAAKLVDCVACHHAANNPARTDAKQAKLRYLTTDPRRASMAEFLVRPDHRLAEVGCRGCHDPLKAHEFLPYRARHMEVLACQACHLAAPMGPTAEMIDRTVVTPEGLPEVLYRNVVRREGEALNAATVRPFRPLLVERIEGDGVRRLSPVNTVSRFRWVSAGVAGSGQAEVPFERVQKAYFEGQGYAPQVLEALDANRDGRLDERELRLDAPAKVQVIAERLRQLGVVGATIEGTLEAVPLSHGVPARERALKECTACHASSSRMSEAFPIAPYLPGGKPPRPLEGSRVELSGVLSPTSDGGLSLQRDSQGAPGGLHVLGHSREQLTNLLGFGAFLAVALGVSVHGLARIALRRKGGHAAASGPVKKEYAFGLYERVWHWTMALSGITLILTGLAVHNAGSHRLLALPSAVWLHNAAAVVLMGNAFLALFYHLVTRAILSFIPEPRGLLSRVLEHMSYQSRGIFFGGPHPANAPGHKLNPLQQITYLALLNILFPVQIGTGVLIWAVGQWPEVAAAVGGLGVIAPVHNAGAWLFLSFFVLHVYLVTTGRTVGDHLQSMLTGYRTLEPPTQGTAGGAASGRSIRLEADDPKTVP